jgi:hypothetical protein
MNIEEHLKRVQDGARDVYSLNNLSAWIERYLRLEGRKFDMSTRYSFQKKIVNDTSRVVNTIKCAQVGLTTATIAYFLAAMATQRKFNTIYALPSQADASKIVTTKINPIILASKRLTELSDKNVDTVELKQLGNNFLFCRGAKSETAALSISADCLVADEIDRSDPDTLKQFRSRLQASELAIVKQFSTPTVDGVGISKEAETSKRYRSFATCYHCNHIWLPSYHVDIKIPGYDRDLSEITRTNIQTLDWKSAHWACPNCNRDPQLHPSRLSWVCENPDDNWEATTYYVNPVTCCEVLRPAYLVRTSTEFNTRSEWMNQVLGETSTENNEQVTRQDVEASFCQSLDSSEIHYLGADMGLLCHVAIGRRTQAGELLIVHRETVPVSNFMQRRSELMKQYRVAVSVMDCFPYTQTIMQICDYDVNGYGCTFSTGNSPELFTIQEKIADAEEGKLNLRLVKANRTRALDEILTLFKEKRILTARVSDSEDDKFLSHVLSMKRVQVFVKDELQFSWKKTDGNDHMMFAVMYLNLATLLRGTVDAWATGSLGLVKSFKLKPQKFLTEFA